MQYVYYNMYIQHIQYYMAKVKLDGYRCERCEHTWIPRDTTIGEPVICPKCKSPYWNKPRRNKVK